MRLLRLISLGLLTSAGLSCAADTDCGGPTSDWPSCNHGGNSGGGRPGGDPDEVAGPSKPVTDGPGKTPFPAMSADAGGLGAPSSPSAGEDTDAGDAGAGDAGLPTSNDAGVPSMDGGSAPSCIFGASVDDAGRCEGLACALPAPELLKLLCTTGHCLHACAASTP